MDWSRVVHVWCWPWLFPGPSDAPADHGNAAANPGGGAKPLEEVSSYAKANAAYWQTATAILTAFTTYILPMMFALLGTLIGAFRAIMSRIGAGELAPRDFVRMKIGVCTGLVAGIAVGLFLSPSSVPAQGAGGVAGELTLTASGLGFLAGYASHSFFGYLDRIVSAIFPLASPAPAATPPILVPTAPAPPSGSTDAAGSTGQTGPAATTGRSAASGPTGA
jgi:hypothetical protein